MEATQLLVQYVKRGTVGGGRDTLYVLSASVDRCLEGPTPFDLLVRRNLLTSATVQLSSADNKPLTLVGDVSLLVAVLKALDEADHV